MKITDVLVAEHTIFLGVFDQIERALRQVKHVGEVRTLAGIVEGLLETHANTETELAYAALDHALAEQGSLRQLYQEHEEIDQTLRDALTSDSVATARQKLSAALVTCRRHFCFEEVNVFPVLEQVLQGDTLKTLAQHWSRWPSRMPGSDMARLKTEAICERGGGIQKKAAPPRAA